MNVTDFDPNDLSIDPMNERKDIDDVADLARSIETTSGPVQPPLVRETPDGETGHAVVVGQRRVLAAREADGVESVPAIVVDYSDDKAALRASIVENADLFRSTVGVKDRCRALQRYWRLLGGEGMPSYAHLGHELGVPRETIRDWLEPLNEDWNDTALDVDATEHTDTGEELANAVGASTMAEIRRATDGGEEGERLARLVADDVLTQADVRDIKADIDEGTPPEDAIEDARRDDARLDVSATFDPDTSKAIKRYADRTGSDPEDVVTEGVTWFLRQEGAFDPPDEEPEPEKRKPLAMDSSGPTTTTQGDRL